MHVQVGPSAHLNTVVQVHTYNQILIQDSQFEWICSLGWAGKGLTSLGRLLQSQQP